MILMSLKKIIKFWLPPILWGALIFSVSSNSVPQVSTLHTVDFALHKIAHVIEYSILGVLIYRAFIQEKIGKKEAIVYAIIIAFFYGITDEFHQNFTPTRTPRLRDVIIDTIGATVGILIVWKLLPRLPKKLLNWAERLDLV